MAISVDTVYQKVLALANKEQRGYITPQEFNLLANKAQLEIFENYFHTLKTSYHKLKNDMIYADETDNINAKLHPFKASSELVIQGLTSNAIPLPSDLYRIEGISWKLPITGTNTPNWSIPVSEEGEGSFSGINFQTIPLEEMDWKEVIHTQDNHLTKATHSLPIYTRVPGDTRKIAIYPDPTGESQTYYTITEHIIYYWKKPTPPNWAYVIVNGKALYNSSSGMSKNFELHDSEEEVLVTRILQLSGIIIESTGLIEVAMADKVSTKQEQNS